MLYLMDRYGRSINLLGLKESKYRKCVLQNVKLFIDNMTKTTNTSCNKMKQNMFLTRADECSSFLFSSRFLPV